MKRILLPLALTALGATSLHSASAQAADTGTCARISTFDNAPRRQNLHRAVLVAVDGGMPGPLDASSWRITPGKHTIKLAEAVDGREFSALKQYERDGHQPDRYKTIEIDAKPGVTYRLAAEFQRAHRLQIRDGQYWQPVVWKETPESCG